MSLLLILCACKQTETEAVTKMIDFTDYTINDVIAWTVENDVASSFSYVYSADSGKEAGCVIAQSVESGMPITDGIVITAATKPLLLAGGEVNTVVPDIIGKRFEDAKNELNALGLPYDVRYSSSAREKDTVILTDPLPGISLSENTKIVLTLSSGKRESQISIVLPIKSESSKDNVIKVYVDGELDRSKTVCLDSSVTSKTFCFQGTGTKEVKFKINNEVAAVYNIDFSSGKVFAVD